MRVRSNIAAAGLAAGITLALLTAPTGPGDLPPTGPGQARRVQTTVTTTVLYNPRMPHTSYCSIRLANGSVLTNVTPPDCTHPKGAAAVLVYISRRTRTGWGWLLNTWQIRP